MLSASLKALSIEDQSSSAADGTPTDTAAHDGASCAQLSETRSAVARVFGTAELLKRILELESENLVCENISDGRVYIGQRMVPNKRRLPAQHLFALQRVNKLFQCTISENKLLQQRMFLRTAEQNDPGEGWMFMSPVVWMMYRLLDYGRDISISRCTLARIDFTVVCDVHTTVQARADGLPLKIPSDGAFAWLRPEASWRKMLIYSTTESEPKEVTSYSRGHHGHCNFWWDDLHTGATLGELADWVVAMADCPYHPDSFDDNDLDGRAERWHESLRYHSYKEYMARTAEEERLNDDHSWEETSLWNYFDQEEGR